MPMLLVVDDDESLRRLMRIELGDAYDVIDSGEPEQGLALALEHKPDAILVDLRMPKYSGYELVQTYTSFSQTQNVPVLVVSGEAGSQTEQYCKKLGAVGYFEKPINFDALRTCLAQVIKKRRYLSRSEIRVRLQLALKLQGTNARGETIDELTTTDHVTLSGFACNCISEFPERSLLEVYLPSHGDVHVGKAQVVQIEVKAGVRQYEFRFIQKTSDWVLQ
jgi:response regulator RpfG family c-di-GMP phosphodiesterase